AVVGMLGGNITKVGGVIRGRDMGGSWGFTGLSGNESYSSVLKEKNENIKVANEALNSMRNMNRTNSVIQHAKNSSNHIAQDTIEDLQYFKAHEKLMSYKEMKKNYDFAVDNIEIPENVRK